jgi:uncharacterized damage-inducible protein DinB
MEINIRDPFSPEDYQSRRLRTSRDALTLGVDTALLRMQETFHDITEQEYNWEPLSGDDQSQDLLLPANEKRVWRVFEQNGIYSYDYSLEVRSPSPFTTIAWIMNHIAQTADMYLYCITTGKPEGAEKTWDDLPVYGRFSEMRDYAFRVFLETRAFLTSLDEEQSDYEVNKLTPAPWGEMRPTYLNIWGGIIEHGIQHAMQIAVRKEYIRVT